MRRSVNPQIKNALVLLTIFATLFDNSKALGMADVEWNVAGWSKALWGIAFGVTFVAFLLMLAGSFLQNKPINFMAGWRIAVFFMGAATPWLIGSELPQIFHSQGLNNSYRGLNSEWFRYLYDRFYDSWWGGNKTLYIFAAVKNDGGEGEEFPGYEHFINKLFFEILLALVGRGLAFTGRPMFTMLSFTFNSIFALRFIVGFAWFWKQHVVIGKFNEIGEDYKKKFSHIFAWMIAVVMFLIALETVIMTFVTAAQAKSAGDGNNRQKTYQETGRNEDGQQQQQGKFFYFLFFSVLLWYFVEFP